MTYYAFWVLALALCVVLAVGLLVLGFVLLGPLLWACEKILGGDSQVALASCSLRNLLAPPGAFRPAPPPRLHAPPT